MAKEGGDTAFAYLARLGVEVRFSMEGESEHVFAASAYKDGELIARTTGLFDHDVLTKLYREVKDKLKPKDEDYAPKPSEYRYTDDHGQVHTKRPSFGCLTVTRPTCSGDQHFFGSSIRSNHFICLELHDAEHIRSLSNDYHHPDKMLFRVEMTLAQWADFVSSHGIGAGTPCTISHRVDVSGYIMHEPEENKRLLFEDEFKERMHRLSKTINDPIFARLKESGPISMAERKEIFDKINTALRQIDSNLPFLASQFNEQMDRTVSEAKREFNNYMAAAKEGIAALPPVVEALALEEPK